MSIRSIFRVISLFLWMVFCVQVEAQVPAQNTQDTLTQIAAQIDQYPVVKARFTQTRKMLALKRPLVTTGQFVFAREYGVLWQIEQPYRISYVLGEDKIIEIGSDGSRKERSAKDVPGFAQVGRVFRAMLGAHTGILNEYFDVSVEGNIKQWTIRLKPKQAQLAAFLGNMRLSGAQHVESIVIDEASGDRTEILFQEIKGFDALNESALIEFKAHGFAGKEGR